MEDDELVDMEQDLEVPIVRPSMLELDEYLRNQN